MNGCYNREPLKETVWAKDGTHAFVSFQDGTVLRAPIFKQIKTEWNDDGNCQYSLTTKDAKCDGCRWNQGGGE